MKAISCWMVAVAVLVLGSSVGAVNIEWVAIGDLGNPDDVYLSGYGGVDYAYNISKFEITTGQYAEFLNAVAATDTYRLYDTDMWNDDWGCRIRRTGTDGSYSYTVAPDWANRPVNFVSWGDAARFANWLHNGQPTGVQNLTTTEDGAYFLNGATSDAMLAGVMREPDARVVIPNEDEWYKAAYYDGDAGVYYTYPTGSDTMPTSEAPPGTDMVSGSANYRLDDYVIGAPYYRTEAGAYSAKPSSSPYGTFDQGGNVSEWGEWVVQSTYRRVLGGDFFLGVHGLRVFDFDNHPKLPSGELPTIGFRIVNFWAPGCGDGIVQPDLGEACDDGNTLDGDGCDANCVVEYCGDGTVQAGLGEVCDDGNTLGDDGCDHNCQTEVCGNGVTQPLLGEECDDGNLIDEDGCDSDCQEEYCGDGTVQAGLGEVCDDGNTLGDDGCDHNCQTEVCGNGVMQPLLGEECDDRNLIDGDGCDSSCIIEYCGDGTVQAGLGEVCDDGNDIGGDGCDANCYEEICGNGITQPLLDEECDDGNLVDDDACSNDCQIVRVPCTEDLDCVLFYNDACGWDKCNTSTGFCNEPIPRIYGDICGTSFSTAPNGAGGTTDILCVLSAFGAGNLRNCPNADIAVATAAQCPRGNGIVNLTDVLKVLDAFGVPAPGAEFLCDCPENPY